MYKHPMVLNETFAEYYDKSKSKEDDLFGVEVELEGKGVVSCVDSTFKSKWTMHVENSLKVLNPGDEAVEYVFASPFNMADTEKAVSLLNQYMTKPGVQVYYTGRGSVHVHVNVLNEKMSTVYNFLALAIIFDELLVSQNGQTRIGNNFCLRVRDAEGTVVEMAESVRNYGNFGNLKTDNRYSSINPMSLFSFGTVEFRSLECTVDSNRILHWVRTLQALKVAARTFKNPTEIISQFSLLGPERFFLNILGAQALPYMRVFDRHQMLFRGVRLCQEFANCSTWEPQVYSQKPKPKVTKKSTAQLYQEMVNASQLYQSLQTLGGSQHNNPPEPVESVSEFEDFDLPLYDDLDEEESDEE